MSKVFGRIWVFLFFLILLVIASFFIAFGGFDNFFKASLISSQQISKNRQEIFEAAQKELPDFQIMANLPEALTSELNLENNGISENLASEESLEDKLDEIAEKIDIIRRQIEDLSAENPKELIEIDNQDDEKENEENEENNNVEQFQLAKQSTKSSGTKPIYPKILISEIQIAGENDEKDEFVELYNPNSFVVSLADWYLQRKTAGSSSYTSYAPHNLFSGKKIGSNDYFLIARQGYHTGSADMFVENPITDDNSFALKNPNGEISDKLGFGSATDYELLPTAQNPGAGQTIGRKVLPDGMEQETDINSADFEIQTPTPKAKNITYVAPPPEPEPPPPPPLKNILINEIQISGLSDEKDEFVELFNPNGVEVDLSGWYLQRKTASGNVSSYAPNTLFSSKTIGSNDYFLIARAGSSFSTGADITTDYSLGDFSVVGGNTLILKRSDRSISDKVGWGNASDFETAPALNPGKGQSIKRKETGLDTGDNSADFIISDIPTPRRE